jgi:PAS domain S-box-containing protein
MRSRLSTGDSSEGSTVVRPASRLGVNILLVDDRPEDLLSLESVLESPDYRLVKASSGTEALRHVLERDFALILLDVHMPSMDGFEVASIVKQRDRSRHIPVIFLTADASDVRAIYRAYSAGAVDYLFKPIDRDIVRAKVGIFVDLYRKDQRIQEQNEALRAIERAEKQRQLAELASQSQKRYRNLAEAIPQIVWTTGPSGGLDYCNQRWPEMSGLTFDQLRGWRWLSAVHPDDRADCERGWTEAVGQGLPHERECRLLMRDGSHRWHLCRALPEREEDGRIIGWLGTYTDCDDLKRAQSVAEAALEARDEFLSIASHELRTPLTALQLQLQSLRARLRAAPMGAIEAKLMGKLEMSIRQSNRLDQLIETLLDVSRLTADRVTLELEFFDLSAAVRDVVERLSEEATSLGTTIQFRSERAVTGRWDKLRVEQVVVNLLTNALKHARGKPVEIEVAGVDSAACVVVRDQGTGISAEALPLIFERFEGSRSREHGGLGLGLYITRRIVEMHGGTVSVSSQPEIGSTFTVELPDLSRGQDPIL